MKRWLMGLSVIAAIWVIGLLVGRGLDSLKPTADGLSEWLETQSISEMTQREREQFLEEYANRINRLSLEERSRMRRHSSIERSFQEMNDDERIQLFDATLPGSLRQLLTHLNDMSRDNRERLINRAMRDLEETLADEMEEAFSDEDISRIVEVGLQTYYDEASAETRLQLMPLMEQMQRRLQQLL